MERCVVADCKALVSKSGHTVCYAHWHQAQGNAIPTNDVASGVKTGVSASALGECVGVKARRINLMFQELGWVTRERKGWSPTEQGTKRGAVSKEHFQSGVPFVLWPEGILEDRLVHEALREILGADGVSELSGALKPVMNLIELLDEHIRVLDDHLPRFLLKHGIQTL